MKIKIKYINGNWIWYNTETKQTTSAEVPIGKLTEDSYKKFIHLLFQMGKRQMVLRLYVDGIVL